MNAASSAVRSLPWHARINSEQTLNTLTRSSFERVPNTRKRGGPGEEEGGREGEREREKERNKETQHVSIVCMFVFSLSVYVYPCTSRGQEGTHGSIL